MPKNVNHILKISQNYKRWKPFPSKTIQPNLPNRFLKKVARLGFASDWRIVHFLVVTICY